MLKFTKNIHVSHNFSKNVSVGEETSFGYFDLLALELVELRPFNEPGHEGINLKSEAPTLWISVVAFEEIDISLGTDLLPGSKGLVKDSELREVLFDYLQNCRLTTAYISLDWNECAGHVWAGWTVYKL